MVNFANKRLLIVDDFESFRLSLRRMLNSIGINEVDITGNGRDAIRLCRENAYDAILCDYNLGQGKNGQQVLEELQHSKILKHRTLFIMISAETGREMVLGALEYSPDGYISKPFTQALLHKRLETFFARQEAIEPIIRALDKNNDAEALRLCQQKAAQPGRYRTWCQQQLAELQIKTGDYEGAKATCELLLSGRQQDLPHLLLGRIALAEGRFEEAIQRLEEVLKHNPNFARACDLIAECYKAMGQPRKAQQSLERATSISPHYLNRQQALASQSQENDDIETATHAWRSTVELSQHSCLEAPDQYLNLARCLGESASENEEQGAKLAREALQMLDRAKQRFSDHETLELESTLVEAQVHMSQNNTAAAEKALAQAETLFAEVDPASRDSLQLELGKTLLQAGRQEQGEQLLNELAAAHPDKSDISSQVAAVLDEPVSAIRRKRAAEFNKQGIEAFKDNRYEEAIEFFIQAQEHSSRHPGVNLNLVQAALKQAPIDGKRDQHYRQCQAALERIAHLKPTHHQWERYQHLKQQVASHLAPSSSN
ncbi:tetratricopeptide repeat-containing response regulator [Aestuariirhabdus litorea]|uniref:Response regulator n=1 Tax=Aestuariirhabdus litorea TaxID=2528527 RepID=A0A3P3VMV9_9GAMM|nr:tetratricopeptide repeat-containing response regulator [Aestuariirhabdus litorea]RRJ82986.1 response regulator [Aestuariirhabdus litorea]RWW93146.1 tetratricopeptide repeat protein [Endozoicomonadaceae bacterium GTF-13]